MVRFGERKIWKVVCGFCRMCRFCEMEVRDSGGFFEEESCFFDLGFGELVCEYKNFFLVIGFKLFIWL